MVKPDLQTLESKLWGYIYNSIVMVKTIFIICESIGR